MTSNAVVRPASFLESYHVARQNSKLDSCVVVAARFVKGTSGPSSAAVTKTDSGDDTNGKLSKEDVYAGLVFALNAHAGLSVKVVRTSVSNQSKGSGKRKDSSENSYTFERLEKVNLEKVVHFLDNRDEEDIATLIQHQFTQPIPSLSDFENDPETLNGVPLWRLIVTPRNMVVFAFHHCIGDGQSGLAFMRTLLQGLNSPPSLPADFNPQQVQTPTDLKLASPVEEVTNVSPSLRTLLPLLLGLLIPSSWTSAHKTWTGNDAPLAPVPLLTRARALTISSDRVSRILSAARKNKTTLTAVLYYLTVDVLSCLVLKEEKEEGGRRWKRLLISVPVSLRPITKVPFTAMAEQASSHRSIEHLPRTASSAGSDQNSSFDPDWWTRASTFSNTLRSSVPKTREEIGTIKYLSGKYEAFFKDKLGKKRGVSLELSNAGVFQLDIEQDSPALDSKRWSITETYFGQDDGATGAALKVNVVGSPSPTNSVNIVVTWGKGAVDDAFAESFVNGLTESVDRLDQELLKDEKGSQ